MGRFGRLIRILGLALIVTPVAAYGGADDRDLGPAPVAPASSVQRVPFRLLNRYSIVVQGKLGASGKNCNLLIDTGANPTVIDAGLAHDLRLIGSDTEMTLMNGPVSFRTVELPWFELGPLRRQKLKVLVRDLKFMHGQLGLRIDAVVGMDLLSMMSFTIDYQHKQLLYGAPTVAHEDAADFISGPPLMVVTATGTGSATPLKLLVDTGTSDIMLFDSRVQGHLREVTLGRRASGLNMAGSFVVDELVLPDVRLGKTRFGMRRAFVNYDQQGWGGTFDGLLGPTALGVKHLTFDFEAGKLRWKR